jgi:hypothetical protein
MIIKTNPPKIDREGIVLLSRFGTLPRTGLLESFYEDDMWSIHVRSLDILWKVSSMIRKAGLAVTCREIFFPGKLIVTFEKN